MDQYAFVAFPSVPTKKRATNSNPTPPSAVTETPERPQKLSTGATPRGDIVRRPYLVAREGKKHHAFSSRNAPYPLYYEPRLLDQHELDHYSQIELNSGNPSLLPHITSDLRTHPRRVLDIGTGTGSYLISAFRAWPGAHITGLDIVDVQIKLPLALDPDFKRNLTRSKIAAAIQTLDTSTRTRKDSTSKKKTPGSGRISFVHCNFLKSLPFPDGEFDLVHVRGIAKGVPEDKWDTLLSEIRRVLRAGGHLELIEEDIIFPIIPVEAGETVTQPLLNARPPDTPNPPTHQRPSSIDFSAAATWPSRPWDSQRAPSPDSSLPIPQTPFSPYNLGATAAANLINVAAPQVIYVSSQNNTEPSGTEDHVVLEKLYYGVFERRFINLSPTAILPNLLNMHLRGVRGSPAVEVVFPGTETPSSRSRSGSDGSTTLFESLSERAALSSDSDTLREDNQSSVSWWKRKRKSFMSIRSSNNDSLPSTNQQGQPLRNFFPPLDSPSTRSLHLYHAWENVLACKEAMWDELQRQATSTETPSIPGLSDMPRIVVRSTMLDALHWEDSERHLPERQRFEALFDRYDLHLRKFGGNAFKRCSLAELLRPIQPSQTSPTISPRPPIQIRTPVIGPMEVMSETHRETGTLHHPQEASSDGRQLGTAGARPEELQTDRRSHTSGASPVTPERRVGRSLENREPQSTEDSDYSDEPAEPRVSRVIRAFVGCKGENF